MTPETLSNLLQKFERCRVLVIGDLMLDEYLWGPIQRISPEAPVPILSVVQQDSTLGGSGNVVKNLADLSACVVAIGVIGDNIAGQRLLEQLDRLGVDREGVQRDPARKSTRKTRLISMEHGQQVFRFDEESLQSIGRKIEDSILSFLEAKIQDTDAVLCSDCLKGVLTPRILQTTFELARRNHLPVVVSPKDSEPGKY